jgi:hypothetical protein
MKARDLLAAALDLGTLRARSFHNLEPVPGKPKYGHETLRVIALTGMGTLIMP